MSAPVRFVRSRDGTRIAYTVEGQGPPLIWLTPALMSHTQLYPELPRAADYLATIARSRTLIRVDFRGTGMAERGVADHSPEAVTDDLEAVVDELRVAPVDIIGSAMRMVAAVRFAVRRPDAVRKMVLPLPIGATPHATTGPSVPGLFEVMRTNWDMWCQLNVQRLSGKPLDEVEHLNQYVRRCVDQQDLVAEVANDQPAETWRLAANVRCPVLVIYRKNALATGDDTANLAQQIPGARLLYLPEEAGPPPFGARPDLWHQPIEEFLGAPAGEEIVPVADMSALSDREREVLVLLARGQTEAEIGETLCIARATVSRHVQNIYGKLGVHRKAEAVAWAVRHGLA